MTSRASVALALAAAVHAARAADPPATEDEAAPIRTAILAELSGSAAHAEGGALALGGRLTLRLGPAALSGGVDVASGSGAEPRFGGLVLSGPGVVHDLTARLGAHAALLAGWGWVRLRDVVDGGWRNVYAGAVGARAGLEWRLDGAVGPRFHPGWLGQLGIAPVVGISGTVAYTETGSDRLRGVEWGGFRALLSLTAGAEVASPPRGLRASDPPATPPPPPVALAAPRPEPPRAPRLPRAAAEVALSTSAGDAPEYALGGRLSWAPTPRAVLAASWDAGEGGAGKVHHLATAGAGLRALRRGFVLEALALAGIHRVEERDGGGSWRSRDLPAAGIRAGIGRAARGGGASFVYGAAVTVLASRAAESRVGRGDVGGALAVATGSVGLAL